MPPRLYVQFHGTRGDIRSFVREALDLYRDSPGRLTFTDAATIVAKKHLKTGTSDERIASLRKKIVDSQHRNPQTVDSKRDDRTPLTEAEEVGLLWAIKAFDRIGRPLQPCDVIEMATDLHKFPNEDSEWNWWSNFRKAYAGEFARARVEIISHDRSNPLYRKLVESFCTKYLAALTGENGIRDHAILNLDETSFYFSNNSFFGERLVDHDYSHRRLVASLPEASGSLVCCITKTGSFLMAALILKSHSHPSSSEFVEYYDVIPADDRNLRNAVPLWFAFNETGVMNSKLFSSFMARLSSLFDSLHPGLHSLVLLDNCSPHVCLNAMKEAESRHMTMLYLPPHTTHWLQPLDRHVFSLFKKEMREKMAKLSQHKHGTVKWNNQLVWNVKGALSVATTAEAITKSWADAGFNEFAKARILAEFDRQTSGSVVDPFNVTAGNTMINSCAAHLASLLAPPLTAPHGLRSSGLVAPRDEVLDSSTVLRLQAQHEQEVEEKAAEAQRQAEAEQRRRLESEATRADRKRKHEEEKVLLEKRRILASVHQALRGCCAECQKVYRYQKAPWRICRNCDVWKICPDCAVDGAKANRFSSHQRKCDDFASEVESKWALKVAHESENVENSAHTGGVQPSTDSL